MPPDQSSIACAIDFERSGRQISFLRFSHSDNDHALSIIPIPIALLANGDGPTVLLSAGNHGDEYEGQVILRRMIRELRLEQVRGRIIILPALNYSAVRAATRTSPLDGANMNRVFPGDPARGPTAAIAHYVDTVLLPMCAAGIDLHSGGKVSEFLPSVFFCQTGEVTLTRKMLAMTDDFGAPITIVNGRDDGGGFDGAAHRRNVAFISTELGGAGTVGVRSLEIGRQGVYRMLHGLGALVGVVEPAPEPGATRFVEIRAEDYLHARLTGIFEAYVELGSEVETGQALGCVHPFDELD